MERKYKHVIIIGLDGMGNFNKFANTPNLDRLFENGAVTLDALSLFPTISAQNWGAMLLGVLPEVHGLTNGIVGTTEYTNKEIPSIFTSIRQKYPDAFLCSCCNWDPINYGIIEHDIGVEMHTAPDDDKLADIIVECISRKPDFLFIQFDDIDGAGHGSGYGTPKYLKQVEKSDGYIGMITDACKSAGTFDDTLFIALADHGGYRHGHGGYTDEEKYIYFALAGKGVNKSVIPNLTTTDINAIVRYAFGIDIPEFDFKGYSSQVPEGVFGDYTRKYIVPVVESYNFTSEETPGFESGICSVFDKSEVELALFFDNDVKDSAGKHTLREVNHVKYYSGGRYGAYGELGMTGYLVCDDISFGTGDFAIGCWVKLDKSLCSTCYICANKSMMEAGPGFSVGYSCAGIRVGIETDDEDSYGEYDIITINDFSGGWMHILCSFDRKENSVTVYANFREKKKILLKDCFRNFNLDAMPFVVGNDASCTCNDKDNSFIFNADDFIVFKKAFSAEDVKKLAGYYKM